VRFLEAEVLSGGKRRRNHRDYDRNEDDSFEYDEPHQKKRKVESDEVEEEVGN